MSQEYDPNLINSLFDSSSSSSSSSPLASSSRTSLFGSFIEPIDAIPLSSFRMSNEEANISREGTAFDGVIDDDFEDERRNPPPNRKLCDSVSFGEIRPRYYRYEIVQIRVAHDVPSDIPFRRARSYERAHHKLPGWCCLYQIFFAVGGYLPFSPFIRSILFYYNLAPAQVMTNSWHILFAFQALCLAHNLLIDPDVFHHFYQLKWSEPAG